MLLKKIIVFLLCLVVNYSFGQLNKANHFYKLGNFQSAIVCYEKVIKKDTSSATMRKLGDCYIKVRTYKLAEPLFSKLVAKNSGNSEDIYQYAIVLLSLGKYDQAITQFESIQSDKKYTYKIDGQLRFCKKHQLAKKSDTNYIVRNHKTLNSKKNEFTPVVVGNELYYTAETATTDLYQVQQNQMLYTQRKRKIFFRNTKKVFIDNKFVDVKTINKTGTNGASSFSDSDQVIYYTNTSLDRFSKDSSKINKPSIFYSKKNKNKWSEPKAFQWNDSRYSFEHPAISKNGEVLIFSSDMPGGFGKSDLYSCEKRNGQWTTPKNLGYAINTSENEVFPYLLDKTTLCFSSDGQVGFGGLDLFQSKLVGEQWMYVKNFGVNANSNKDDFGICFIYKDSLALFSSNRDGGTGGDDIYDLISLKKETHISANIYLTENIKSPAKNKNLYLLNSENEKIDSTFTDQFGHFDFKIFDVENNFMVEVDETDSRLKNKARYYIIDNNNVTSRISHKLSVKEKYVFKNLPINSNGLPDLFEEDTLNFAGKLFLKAKENSPLDNRVVMLINEFGDVVEKTTTNEFGAFAFRNLPPNQNYSIYINDENLAKDAEIILTNKIGKEIKTTKMDNQDNLNFEILSFDKSSHKDLSVTDSQLLVSLSGYLYDQDKKSLANLNVAILDNETIIQNIVTDSEGRFQTQKLDVDKTYSFLVDDSENKYEYVSKLYLADSRRRIYKEIGRRKDGKFHFNLLNIDKCLLGENTFDDSDMLALKLKNKQNTKDTSITTIDKSEVSHKLTTSDNRKMAGLTNELKKNEEPVVKNKKGILKDAVVKEEQTVNLNGTDKTINEIVSGNKNNVDTALEIINLDALVSKNKQTVSEIVLSEKLNYASGEYKINDKTAKILNNIITSIKANPSVGVDINSHTDAKGSDTFNMLLSQRRANAVFNYFISKGITRNRLLAKGFGETQLLNKCTSNEACDDAQHLINRRTEFRFYKMK